MNKNPAAKAIRKRWQFCWCNEDSPPTNGDAHDWKTKVFRVATFEKAMDKMLEFVRRKQFVCLVDYECAALHVSLHTTYSDENHDAHFPRIDNTEHPLTEYVG